MNTKENNKEAQGTGHAAMEARIISWVSGECSAEEAAELGRLCAADAGLAAYRTRIASVRELAAAAGSPDPERLRLSEERRGELMGAFGAAEAAAGLAHSEAAVPTLSQLPTIMRRLNLAYAAVFSVVLIAGVTWWGERTHYVPVLPKQDPPPTTAIFTVEPDKPVPVESVDPAEKKPREDIVPPAQTDIPSIPKPDDITEQVEPPRPEVDFKMAKIPAGGEGLADHAFNLSQLDQMPVAKHQVRPIYPDTLRHEGITGEVMVDFIVDPAGEVRNAVAVRSSQREFEEPACTAVSKWKFSPGRKGGRAVFTHMQVPIIFSLTQDDGK